MKRRSLVLAPLAAGAASLGRPARAQAMTRIVYGYTAVTDFATVFLGVEEGYFRKRNLEVEPKFIPLNSTIPAAIQSESLHIGGPTPSVYLQSVDGGLDHVVVGGGGVTAKNQTGYAVVARAGTGIRTAQDFIGKKVGVPGLGAFLHVGFRAWLRQSGVDYKKVNFVEASFPQHGDLLRGGSIDAVVTADPFMARIIDSGAGYVASYYGTFLTEGMPTILHAASREWVARNPVAARSFREALVEAAAFQGKPANDKRVREVIGKYIKVPPEVLAKMQLSVPGPVITEKQLAFWVRMMKDQEMLRTEPRIATLIAK